MIDYRFIKQLVESYGSVDDISDKSRKRYMVNLRATYTQLSFLYVDKFTQEGCGKIINRDHGTIINYFKIFKNDYGTEHFKAKEVFDYCNLKLKKIYSIMLENKIKSDIENIDLIIKTYKEIRNKIINKIEVEFEQINN